jgi:hypothetical protein
MHIIKVNNLLFVSTTQMVKKMQESAFLTGGVRVLHISIEPKQSLHI